MNRSNVSRYRFAFGCFAALCGLVAATAGSGQAQVGLKIKPLPSKAVVKGNDNVLPPLPVGAAGRLQREIVALTNKFRQEHNLKPLQVRMVLTSVAQKHASNMAGKETMSHNLDGKNVRDRLDDAKYQYSKYGENIAFRTDFPTASIIVSAWMNSPGHRANILDPEFTEISVGVAKSGRTGATYVCQVFGAPK